MWLDAIDRDHQWHRRLPSPVASRMDAAMRIVSFGSTGLRVSVLGLGAGSIGDASLSEDHAGTLLNRAVERGVTLVDTAPSYGLSEARIGRHLSWRRGDFVLSTKLGYGVPGLADWTPECVDKGVDLALQRLRTDRIDVAHLHSCPVGTLASAGVAEALGRAVDDGRVRVAAYSGDNDALAWAARSGLFGAVQFSLNVLDRHALRLLPELRKRGLGLIIKRGLANVAWRYAARPERPDLAEYWRRARALGIDDAPDTADRALRWCLDAAPDASVLIGTRHIAHLEHDIALATKHQPEARPAIDDAYTRVGADWPALI